MKTNIKQLNGNWDLGYALDKHTISSDFIGHNEYGRPMFDTVRPEAGEALFQLKYRDDWTQIPILATELAESTFPKFDNVGLLIPMPPSKRRAKQPVTELTKALGKIVGLTVFDNILHKEYNGEQLKDVGDKEDKINLLKDSFTILDGIQGTGPWNVLIVDDLYDTGASLETACKALRTYKKINKIYVTTVTWK